MAGSGPPPPSARRTRAPAIEGARILIANWNLPAPEGRGGGRYGGAVLRRRRDHDQRGFRYSRWDGTQRGFDLDADALLDEMTDDLLYHGDLHASLRRLMQQGMRDRD